MSTSSSSKLKTHHVESPSCSKNELGRIRRWFAAWVEDEDGATAVEYAVMVGLIAVTCIVSVNLMTSAAKESFQNSAEAIGQ